MISTRHGVVGTILAAATSPASYVSLLAPLVLMAYVAYPAQRCHLVLIYICVGLHPGLLDDTPLSLLRIVVKKLDD